MLRTQRLTMRTNPMTILVTEMLEKSRMMSISEV